MERLTSDNPFERIQAARIVCTTTHHAYLAIRTLSGVLQSHDPEARSLAAFFLGKLGSLATESLPALTELLTDQQPLVRLHAGEAILKIEPSATDALTELIRSLSDSNSEVRYMAVFALAGIPASHEPRAIQALTAAMDDTDPRVASAAAVANECVRNKIDRALPLAIPSWQGKLAERTKVHLEALNGTSTDDRVVAARTLGSIGEAASGALADLRERLDDPTAIVRGHAARAVWLIEHVPDGLVSTLGELLKSDAPGTTTIVLQTLGEIGPPASDLLAEVLRHATAGDETIQVHAASAAAKIEPTDTRGWDVLSSMRREDDSNLRLLTVIALTNIAALRPDFVENELCEAMRDRNLRVRTAATEGLALIHAANAPDGSLGIRPQVVPVSDLPISLNLTPDDVPVAASETLDPVSLLTIEEDPTAATLPPEPEETVELLSPSVSLRVPTTSDSIPLLAEVASTQSTSVLPMPPTADLSPPSPATPSLPAMAPSPVMAPRSATAVPDLDDVFGTLDRPIQRVKADSQTLPGELPPNHAAARMIDATPIRHSSGMSRSWYGNHFGWEPTGLHHNPLYFEELNAERYGHHFGMAQGLVSGAHFFGTIPTLPYRMTANPPWECLYTLGLDRPGNCVPLRYHRLPWHTGAAIVQAGALAGVVFLVP